MNIKVYGSLKALVEPKGAFECAPTRTYLFLNLKGFLEKLGKKIGSLSPLRVSWVVLDCRGCGLNYRKTSANAMTRLSVTALSYIGCYLLSF